MARSEKTNEKPPPKPIMSPESERFMAYSGLIAWTHAVVRQANEIVDASQMQPEQMIDPQTRREWHSRVQVAHHVFALAANHVIEYRKWCAEHGLFKDVDFKTLDALNEKDIRDLRNMREHEVDYFQGKGRAQERFMVETPEFSADASAVVGTIIGGRLDWTVFTKVATDLLPELQKEDPPKRQEKS